MNNKLDTEIKTAIKKWETNEISKELENFLDKLFAKYPNNDIIDEVLLKVGTLNSIYATNLTPEEVYKVSNHITSNAETINSMLKNDDKSVVDKIARVKLDTNKYKTFFSFATKYCAFHKPNEYALYDRKAVTTLYYFNECNDVSLLTDSRIDAYAAKLKTDYKIYLEMIDDFRKKYCTEKFSYRELDHYLWLMGKELLKKE